MTRQGKYQMKHNDSSPLQSYLATAVNYLTPVVKFSSIGIFFFVAILTASLFAYVAFYQAVVPDIEFNLPLNFRYDTACYLFDESQTEAKRCTFPLSNVSLFRQSGIQLLTPGQEYVFSVSVEVPESDVNYQIGNFLVGLDVFGENNHKQYSETENVLLTYRSALFTVLRTVVLFPMFLLGYVDQRQSLKIVFEKIFTESLFVPSNYLIVQLHSRYLQFYTANLKITAQLRGIKYALFAHPLISGTVIVAILMGLFGMIVVISVCQRLYSSMSVSPPAGRTNGLPSSDVSSTASSTPRSTSPAPSLSPSRPTVMRTNYGNAGNTGDSSKTEDNAVRFRPTVSGAANQDCPPDEWSPSDNTFKTVQRPHEF